MSQTTVVHHDTAHEGRPGSAIGTVLCRVIVPLWVLTGAIFKLWERDPKLLPPPVLDTIRWIGQQLSLDQGGFVTLLSTSLRLLIGIELVLVAIMFFVPLLARKAAIFILSVFVVILGIVLYREFNRGGVNAMFGGSCGCFGSSGPPPWIMLTIDLILLIGVIIFRPLRRATTAAGATLGFLGAVVGMSVALLVPGKVVAQPTPSENGDVVATDSTAASWPAPPALAPMYYPQFDKWIGAPLRDQDMAKQISRPLPEGFDTGGWLVVFFRGDCDHCHELIETFITGDLVARTLLVRVPDTDRSADLPLPDRPFLVHELPQGPDYVFTTPVLLAVSDGVVKAMATSPEDPAAVNAAIAAMKEEAAGMPAPSTPSSDAGAAKGDANNATTTPATTTPPASPPPAAVSAGWPKKAALQAMYFPQFEDWVGQRLDAQSLAQVIQAPVPNLDKGTWHVLFFRADCDHCHEVIEFFIDGDVLDRTVLVQVPDTDPANDLPMPDRSFKRTSLPKGPDYVLTTPVLLTVEDGVITCIATDPDDHAQIETCLTGP